MQTSPSSRREQSGGDRISQDQSTPTSSHNSVESRSNTSPNQEEDEDLDKEDEEGEETGGSEDEDEGDENTEALSSPELFALDHCKLIEQTQTFAFQIRFARVKNYSVRFNPEENSGRPICSCPEVGTCQHIAWLLEQLQPSIAPGIDQRLIRQERLHETGLDNICHALDWELRDDPDAAESEYQLVKKNDTNSSSSGSVVHPPSHSTRGMRDRRLATVRDIMATLSHNEVQETYRPDIFDDNGREVSDYSVAPQDLEKTLARILFHNDRTFRQFDGFVRNDVRAEEYFRKMVYKAQSVCASLDEYVENGPGISGKTHDVIWCGNELVGVVEAIRQNIELRAPLSSHSKEVAAKALIDILQIVIHRNAELYVDNQNMNWTRRKPHGEKQIKRNLYQFLIGTRSSENPAQGTFVLNVLQDLPEAVVFIEELDSILAIVRTVAYNELAYTERLKGIISRLKGMNTPGESSSSGKRPASDMDRRAKRMK